MRERVGSKAICSICRHPAPTYDHLGVRRFEFVPFWGFCVFLLYRMRRVNCAQCGVKVEAVPWGCGKHQMTTAYVLFLAHWAKKLSWKETALSFRTSWDKVCQAVEVVVAWGLEHRTLGPIQVIGVDEVAYGKAFSERGIAYLHIAELDWAGGAELTDVLRRQTRSAFNGALIFCGGYTAADVETLIEQGVGDAVAFGRSYIANPDLVDRFRQGADLNTPYGVTF